jgi:4'-phosphopantetheinyl transferase
MIICCHSGITGEWSEQELNQKLELLTPELQRAALQKRKWIDRQLFIAGKLLIPEVLKNLGLGDISFGKLEYNIHKRPFFNTCIDFNISHSGNQVVCCGTLTGMVGIDIEQAKVINLDDYADYFTPNEWEHIQSQHNRFKGFYNLWTRKEAVLKAIGTGFHTPLNSVDVVEDMVEYDNITYYIQQVNIAAGYPCHVASTIKDEIKLATIKL